MDLDYFISLILGVFICVAICVFIFCLLNNDYEKECVVFYKENHYITKNCEEYRENLENMEVYK